VILPDDVVPDVAQHVAQCVADHRGPQVADVHLLGHVRLRVVDDDPLTARLEGLGLVDRRCQGGGQHGQVDETGAGHRRRPTEIIDLQCVDQACGDIARRQAQQVAEPEREIALVVPELGLRRRPQFRIEECGIVLGIRRAEGSRGGGGQSGGQDRQNSGHREVLQADATGTG